MKKPLNTIRRVAAASLALALTIPAAVAGASEPLPSPAAGQPASQVQSAQPAASVKADKLVPLRDYSESAGAAVLWHDEDRAVTVKRGQTEIKVKIGEAAITVNGKAVTLDKPVEIVNEKTVLPLGVLADALGIRAGWNEETHTIVIAQDDYALLASAFMSALQAGELQKAQSFFTDKLPPQALELMLPQIKASIANTYGPLGALLAVEESSNAVHHNATIAYATQAIPFEITIRFDQTGKIDDFFVPYVSVKGSYVEPSYDDPSKYVEKEVVVGEGTFALPGTLTMPVGKGPFPAVVLVHGSGPNDRDETAGSVKTFRDMAVGLAAQGVAVLRYEKITREHVMKMQLGQLGQAYTVNEETVKDAVSAVKLLKQTEGIDPSQIYVAGHSQGGMVMPRIIDAAKDTGLAGTILLAAPTEPLETLLVKQTKYQLDLLKKAGQPTETAEQQLVFLEQQVNLLQDPQYSVSNIPQAFAMGSPVWWFDIRNTYAAEQAKDQTGRMLVLQGGNDIQVFPDSLDTWKKTLSARTDVEYKLYPKVNHTMVEYEGQSTGAEYAIPANVPDYLITDIAKWILR